MARLRAILLLLLLPAAASGADGGILRLRVNAEPVTFDWTVGGGYSTRFVFTNIMDGLMGLDANLAPVPRLARTIDVSPDGLTYTFNLREGVKWSDGKALAADDFVASWRRLLDPLRSKGRGELLRNVVNAGAYRAGTVKDFGLVGVKAVAPLKLEVRLARRQTDFLSMLAIPAFFPIRGDLVERLGARGWCEPGKLVTLGPFVPVAREAGAGFTLRRNPGYWGPAPAVSEVRVSVIDEDARALAKFKAGELDAVLPINFKDAGELKGQAGFHVANQLSARTLFLNTTKFPLALAPFRRALAHAIDRDALTRSLGGVYDAAELWLPARLLGVTGLDQTAPPHARFDAEKARAALAESGLAAARMPKLELAIQSSDVNAHAAGFLAAQIQKTLGVTVEVKALGREAFIQAIEVRSHDLYLFDAVSDYPDPYPMLAVLLSSSAYNAPGWKNPDYDALVRQLEVAPAGPERERLGRKAVELVLGPDAPIVPLYLEAFPYLVSPRVTGFEINPVGDITLRTVKMTP